MTAKRLRRRPGFALPAAIMALVLLSALVAGALFVATGELQSGQGDTADQRALAAAEWALDRAMLEWDVQRNTLQAVGATTVTDEPGPSPNERMVVTTTRVQRLAVWMTATATSGDGRSIPVHHTVAASLRLVAPTVAVRAALTSFGSVTVNGGLVDGAVISSRDSATFVDTTGVCRDRAGAGIASIDTSQVTCVTCSSTSTGIFGSPPIDAISALDSASNVDVMLATLATRATTTLPGGTFVPRPSARGDACDRQDVLNWGSPLGVGPCTNWFPVVHVRGAAVLAAGSVGQGILIVSGRLRVEANARFEGIVIASGGIDVDGAGAEINGAAFAGDADSAGGARVSNGGAIRLATCALRRALLGTARLERAPGRWWAELR